MNLNIWVVIQVTEGDEDRSREERTFRIWLNSLLPAGVHIGGDLASDLRDGYVLLFAMDAVLPGVVEVRVPANICMRWLIAC